MNALQALALAKAYTKATIEGEGAIKGKDGRNCKIKSIEKIGKQSKVTFEWTNDDGTTKTDYILVEDGLDGVDGKSAYQIAVSLGYTGTEQEWVDSLKGNKGDKGVGIESITKQGTSGLVDTYIIVFEDGSTTTFDVTNGANISKTSQLENDNEFITNATIGLINYYLKDEVYSKSKIDELLRNIGAGLSVKIVPELPTEDISGTTIYLINTSSSNYNQYMYIDNDWASLGSTSVDLSSYYNKTQIDNMLLGYVTSSILLTHLMAYTKTADLAKVAKSNDYNDLDNLPTLPDVSGMKPYAENLQDSNNTAPTSKVVYDAVQTINGKLDDKLEEADLEPYAKSKDVPEIDDTSTTATNKVWSAKKVNDSLVNINTNLSELGNAKVREFLQSGNLNTITTEGLYSIGHLNNFTNAPRNTDEQGVLRITKSPSDMVCQEWIPRNGKMSYRVQISGTTWGSWSQLSTGLYTESLILAVEHTGGTYTTYSSRKFSSYKMLIFTLGASATDIRDTCVVISASFVNGVKPMFTIMHGASSSYARDFMVSGVTITCVSDTSYSVALDGAKAIKYIGCFGIA